MEIIDDIMRTKIKILRAEKKMTQKLVAQQLGISQRAYSKIELGHTKLRIEHLINLASIFKVPIRYFFEDIKC